jgi:hypothetical protein
MQAYTQRPRRAGRPRSVRALIVIVVASLPTVPLIAGDLDGRGDRIIWRGSTNVKLAEGIFPSPHDPDRVIVATAKGLFQTLDDARTWAPMADTGREVLGRVSDLCYSPFDEKTLFIGSKDKGVFRSGDNGRTWTNVGTSETGLLAPRVLRLRCSPTDMSMSTLYACHGDDVMGMSKSIDGGKSWFKISDRYIVGELLLNGNEFMMSGCPTDEGDVWSVYRSTDGGLYWREKARNVRAGSATASHFRPRKVWHGILPGKQWFGLMDNRILKSEGWDVTGPEQPADWTSMFSTFGAKADEEVLYAYDPHSQGLIMSKDGFATSRPENDGLFVGRLIKEGACVRANPNGSTFYAAINGQLYIGKRSVAETPAIANAHAVPGVVRVPYHSYITATSEVRSRLRELSEAKHVGSAAVKVHKTVKDLSEWTSSLNVSFTARVFPADETQKIDSVSIDLSQLLGSPKAQMFDDGKHGDGAAGDGLYGLTFPLTPRCLDRYSPDEKLPRLPGQTGLTVTATDDAKRTASSVIVFSIYPRGENLLFWNGDSARWGGNMILQGECGVTESETEQRSGARCLHVVAAQGPWACSWGREYEGKNISEVDYLTFWIKAPEGGGDIRVSLHDAPMLESASFSNDVWLMKDGYLKARNNKYELIRIPMVKLLSRTGFQPDQCGGIVFGGLHPNGDDFYVDDVGFEAEQNAKQ